MWRFFSKGFPPETNVVRAYEIVLFLKELFEVKTFSKGIQMKKKIAIALSAEILDEVDFISKKESLSRSQEIEKLILEGLKKTEVKTAVLLIHKNKKEVLFKNSNELLKKQYEFLKKNRIQNIIFVSEFKESEKRKIEQIFQEINLKIISDKSNGTAQALKKANKHIFSDFILINADTYNEFDLKKMISFHKETKTTATLGLINSDSPEKYGSVILDGTKIIKFSEKAKPLSNIISAGIYILKPKIFASIKNKKSLEKEIFPELAESREIRGFFTFGQYQHFGN